jgi:hypothetical protein
MVSSAFGQATRTWVSGVGDDANPCSRTAPCKTFAGAISKTAIGGEIDALDPGGFGAVTITKSISIVAVGVVAGVLVSSGNGITVNAPGAVVVLRGLTIEGLGTGVNGIQFDAGSALYVEDCTINNFQQWGIYVDPSAGQSNVFVSHTVLRNNSDDGIFFGPTGSATVFGTLDNIRTENNGDSGVEAAAAAPARAIISVESSTSANNSRGIVAGGQGGHSTISLSNVTVFGNTTGLSALSGGDIISFGNNRILDNVTNGRPSRYMEQE